MHVKSKQLCEYPLDQKERLGLLATAVSLRDLCWMVLLSLFFMCFSCLCIFRTPSGPIISIYLEWIPILSASGMWLGKSSGWVFNLVPIPLPPLVVEADEESKAVGSVANRMGSTIPPLVLALLLESHENFRKLFNFPVLQFPHL